MSIFNRVFRRWTKWEIKDHNVERVRLEYYMATGIVFNERTVRVDIYQKTNKYTGLKKYKIVQLP